MSISDAKRIRFRASKQRKTAACVVFALGFASLAGCAGKDEVRESIGYSTSGGVPELIGGHPAAPDHFRATVGIGDNCTAAKVGARLFLTAAHCVSWGRPNRSETPAEDFPKNGGVHDNYLPGKPLLIYWGLDADGKQGVFTIAKTSIHPSWWACPRCQHPIVDSSAADVALIEIGEDTPEIPQARVELGSIATGTQVLKVGWGCEQRTDVDPNTVRLGRYKSADASIIAADEIRQFDSRIGDEQLGELAASYLFTAGHAKDKTQASLCLGDSGGPLYLRELGENGQARIVGVNADYSFEPVEDPDAGGVSSVDWHTRTSLASGRGVGQWLRDLNVNTVDGS